MGEYGILPSIYYVKERMAWFESYQNYFINSAFVLLSAEFGNNFNKLQAAND